MRPLGPDPASWLRSTPASCARLRIAGDVATRPCGWPLPAPFPPRPPPLAAGWGIAPERAPPAALAEAALPAPGPPPRASDPDVSPPADPSGVPPAPAAPALAPC